MCFRYFLNFHFYIEYRHDFYTIYILNTRELFGLDKRLLWPPERSFHNPLQSGGTSGAGDGPVPEFAEGSQSKCILHMEQSETRRMYVTSDLIGQGRHECWRKLRAVLEWLAMVVLICKVFQNNLWDRTFKKLIILQATREVFWTLDSFSVTYTEEHESASDQCSVVVWLVRIASVHATRPVNKQSSRFRVNIWPFYGQKRSDMTQNWSENGRKSRKITKSLWAIIPQFIGGVRCKMAMRQASRLTFTLKFR